MLKRYLKRALAALVVTVVPLSALSAQSVECASDNLWNLEVHFDPRKYEDDQTFCGGQWDCISEETNKPDIQICITGRACTDVDDTRFTTKACRDALVCKWFGLRIGQEAISVEVKDDDAMFDDKMTPRPFLLRRDDPRYSTLLKIAYWNKHERTVLANPTAFYNGDFGKAVIEMEPAKGWVPCPAYGPLDRVVRGVDLNNLINDSECLNTIAARERMMGQSALTTGMRGSGFTTMGPMSLVNLGILSLNSRTYIALQKTAAYDWDDQQWGAVIDGIDALPTPDRYEDLQIRKLVETIKGCMRP